MKKRPLNVEELAVVSFQTSPPARDNGTVQGCAFAWSNVSICPGTTTTHTSPP